MNVNWAGAWVAGESVIDTSLYDRVEIVRGATGLMTGAGNPSASVNLVRKHADSHERKTALEAGVGRYGDLKLNADHSQPLTQSGNLRGRIIANHQGGKTFIDREKDKSSTLYGVLDADITPTTSASLGISHQRNDKDGAMWGGLPVTYTDGSFTNWKRGKSDSTNWSYWDSRTTNLFIEGKQALNDNWNVSLKADHRNATGDSELFYFSGGSVNRNGLDWTPWPGKFHTDAKQNTIQLQTDGKIQAWGQEHDLIAGIQYNRHHRSSYSWDKGDIAPASDFNTWNGNYPRPNWGARSLSHDQTDTETALYAATRLRITDQLSTIIGTRVSNWKSTGESYTKPFTQKNSAIWTPYAGITYDITPNQTVYASYADIYKPQTERDRNNNLLDPIRGSTYELGWKANWLDGRLNTQVSAYRTRQDNLAQSSGENIIGVTPPTTAYYAAKGAKVSGFELETSGNIGENLRLGAGYTQWTGKDAKGKKTEHHPPAQTTQTVCQLRRPCRQRPHRRRRSCLAKPHLDRDQKPGDGRQHGLRPEQLRRGQPDEPLPNQRTPLGANQHRQPLRQKIPQPAQLQPIRLRRPALHQRQLQIRILKPLPAQRKPRIRGVFTACIACLVCIAIHPELRTRRTVADSARLYGASFP